MLDVELAHIGIRLSDTAMDVMEVSQATSTAPITLALLLDRIPKLLVSSGAASEQKRIEIRLSQVTAIEKASIPGNRVVLIVSVACNPEYRTHVKDVSATFACEGRDWSSWREFERETPPLGYSASIFDSTPRSMYGRCKVFAFVLSGTHKGSVRSTALDQLRTSLHAYNVDIAPLEDMQTLTPSCAMSSQFASLSDAVGAPGYSDLDSLANDDVGALDFELRFLLEACISQGLLYEGTFTPDFLKFLSSHPVHARDALENALLDFKRPKKPYYNAMDIMQYRRGRKRKRCMPSNCVLMHTITITPTTIYLNVPAVEISNRVVRRYDDHANRFMRVRFAEEDSGPLRPKRDQLDDQIFGRVQHVLEHGIVVAGRHYEFLAYGNSQIREQGAYFFASTKTIDVQKIRGWMGDFSHIKVVAKHASRLGQCFSTTRAISSIGARPLVQQIDDITRNGYVFSDGCGRISVFLATMIAREFGLERYPSAYQFRMGGSIGVLVVVAEDDRSCQGTKIQIRPSQKKFEASYSGLEIIRYSSLSSAFLNSQIILVLHTLGISTETFLVKMKETLRDMDEAMHDDAKARLLLRDHGDDTSTMISQCIAGGLGSDPAIKTLLRLWRAWSIRSIKEKFRILIKEGAFVLGCIDETGALDGTRELPQVFLQVSDSSQHRKSAHRIITGKVLLLRNPALAPGDIRIVQAVDCPRLRHLKDVVVLPQTGERPLSDMCAGGDLDGDDYMVIWDPSLIPAGYSHAPMPNVAHSASKMVEGTVQTHDIVNFYVDFLRNNSLGQIAVAHRVFADRSALGVKDEKCMWISPLLQVQETDKMTGLALAELHSLAVDYCKSGQPARMTPDLFVREYPHWMAKPSYQRSYRSKSVLGRLYDDVQAVEFSADCATDFSFNDLLLAYPSKSSDVDLAFAREIKEAYDLSISRLMNQFGLKTEFEAFSAFALEIAPGVRHYELAQDIGNLMQSIKSAIREMCYAHLHVKKENCNRELLGPLVIAIYRSTAEAYTAWRGESTGSEAPFITLPYVFAEDLIATMKSQGDVAKSTGLEGQSVPGGSMPRARSCCVA